MWSFRLFSNFWYFFIPIFLLKINITLPFFDLAVGKFFVVVANPRSFSFIIFNQKQLGFFVLCGMHCRVEKYIERSIGE